MPFHCVRARICRHSYYPCNENKNRPHHHAFITRIHLHTSICFPMNPARSLHSKFRHCILTHGCHEDQAQFDSRLASAYGILQLVIVQDGPIHRCPIHHEREILESTCHVAPKNQTNEKMPQLTALCRKAHPRSACSHVAGAQPL